MSVISTLDGVSVKVSGQTTYYGSDPIQRSTNLGTLNASRFDDTKANAIITALQPVVDFTISKKQKTEEFFLTASE